MHNDMFRSFFRTIGRILAYIFIGFLISIIIGYLKPVKATSIKTYVNDLQYDSSTLSTSWYTYRAAGNRNIFFDLVFDTEVNNRWNYVSLVLCSSSGFSGGIVPSGYQNYIKGISYNETSYSCPYANSSYGGGKVVIINFMLFNGEGEFSGYFTTYQNGSASIQLIDFVINDNQFVAAQNYSSYDLIIKNSQIINQNNTIINQGQQTNDKLDDLNDKQNQTNQKLDDVNNSLKDETPPNLKGLENSAGWLPAGPLDSILNLPLSLLQNLSTNLSKSCQPVNLPLPYVDKTLTLPCVSTIYSQIEGLNVWLNTIGVIASAFILFFYLVHLEKWVDDTLTLRENNYIDNWGGM